MQLIRYCAWSLVASLAYCAPVGSKLPNAEDMFEHKPSFAAVVAVDDASGTTISCAHQEHLFSNIFAVDITRTFDEEDAIATYMFEFDLDDLASHTQGERIDPVRVGTLLSIAKKQGCKHPIDAVDEVVKQTYANAWITVKQKENFKLVSVESVVGTDKLELVEVVVPDDSWPYLMSESGKDQQNESQDEMTHMRKPHRKGCHGKHSGKKHCGGKHSGRKHHGAPHHERPHPDSCNHMKQLKDTMYHYYRGANSSDYSEISQIGEYVHTFLVGIVMPIVVLGLVLAAVALGVYAWCAGDEEKEEEMPPAYTSIAHKEPISDDPQKPVSEKERLLIEDSC